MFSTPHATHSPHSSAQVEVEGAFRRVMPHIRDSDIPGAVRPCLSLPVMLQEGLRRDLSRRRPDRWQRKQVRPYYPRDTHASTDTDAQVHTGKH